MNIAIVIGVSVVALGIFAYLAVARIRADQEREKELRRRQWDVTPSRAHFVPAPHDYRNHGSE